MSSNDYKIKMSSEASQLIHRLDPLTKLETQEFKIKHRIYAEKYGLNQDFDKRINDLIELCKEFRNCFNNYLEKISDLIKTKPFNWFSLFGFNYYDIEEEIIENFITNTKNFNNSEEVIRNEFHFGYNFEELLKNLIEIIYNGFETLYKDLEKYEKKYFNEYLFNLSDSYLNIFEEFWKEIPNYLNEFGFHYRNYRFMSFEVKYEKDLNTGLENSNRLEIEKVFEKFNKSEEQNSLNTNRIIRFETELESKQKEITNNSNVIKELEKKYKKCEKQLKNREQEVIELNTNIREQKKLFEELSSSRDRIESELKLSTDLNIEMISEIKELKEYNKELTENYNSIQTKINEMFEFEEKANQMNEKFEEQVVMESDLSLRQINLSMAEEEVEVISNGVIPEINGFENKILKIELKEIQENYEIESQMLEEITENHNSIQTKTNEMFEFEEKSNELNKKIEEQQVVIKEVRVNGRPVRFAVNKRLGSGPVSVNVSACGSANNI